MFNTESLLARLRDQLRRMATLVMGEKAQHVRIFADAHLGVVVRFAGPRNDEDLNTFNRLVSEWAATQPRKAEYRFAPACKEGILSLA